jgi:DNA polymerase III epsilon subunit-like protein
MKILYLDTETTGLDPKKNDIIQIGGIYEKDGIVIEEFDIKMQPLSYDNIEPKALETNGFTIEQIRTFPTQKEGYDAFVKKIQGYEGKDKFSLVGQNCRYDIDMTIELFNKNGRKGLFFGLIDLTHYFDVMSICKALKHMGYIDVPKCNLEELAKYFGVVNNKAHDALEDVRVTKAIYTIIKDRYFIDGVKAVHHCE